MRQDGTCIAQPFPLAQYQQVVSSSGSDYEFPNSGCLSANTTDNSILSAQTPLLIQTSDKTNQSKQDKGLFVMRTVCL